MLMLIRDRRNASQPVREALQRCGRWRAVFWTGFAVHVLCRVAGFDLAALLVLAVAVVPLVVSARHHAWAVGYEARDRREET